MDQFSGPVDEEERRRLGNRRMVGGLYDDRRGPLEPPVHINKEGLEQLQRLTKLEKQLKGVDRGILEVEQHIIDKMKTEAGSSNMKAWAESLEIVRKLERRET